MFSSNQAPPLTHTCGSLTRCTLFHARVEASCCKMQEPRITLNWTWKPLWFKLHTSTSISHFPGESLSFQFNQISYVCENSGEYVSISLRVVVHWGCEPSHCVRDQTWKMFFTWSFEGYTLCRSILASACLISLYFSCSASARFSPDGNRGFVQWSKVWIIDLSEDLGLWSIFISTYAALMSCRIRVSQSKRVLLLCCKLLRGRVLT